MNKIFLIIQREYLTRVKKRTFIVMTLIGTLLMATLYIWPIYLASMENKQKNILVVDETHIFPEKNPEGENIIFEKSEDDILKTKETYDAEKYDGILYIPMYALNNPGGIVLFSEKQVSLTIVSYIEKTLQSIFEDAKLEGKGIDPKILMSIRTKVKINSIVMKSSGAEMNSNADIATAIGFIGGFMIYIFIFMYGSQVMRGVIEEKTNRIIEVVITSVKPFQLMMGKIIGIALVGLTQFILWLLLTFAITTAASHYILHQNNTSLTHMNQTAINANLNAAQDTFSISDALQSNLDIPVIIIIFILYFIGGYLLYGSLFAAIGSAVDSESDTQQFMFPITIPLVLSIILSQAVISNPDSTLSYWLSIIPLTSPVIMMMRIPFGVPPIELFISIGLLITGFIFTTWLASKIYRTGILRYGKKTNYSDLFKWITKH